MRPLLYVTILSALALPAACNKGDTTGNATPAKAKSDKAKDQPVAAPMVKDEKPEPKPTEVKAEPEKAEDFDSDGGADEPEKAEPPARPGEEPEDPEEPEEPEELDEPE